MSRWDAEAPWGGVTCLGQQCMGQRGQDDPNSGMLWAARLCWGLPTTCCGTQETGDMHGDEPEPSASAWDSWLPDPAHLRQVWSPCDTPTPFSGWEPNQGGPGSWQRGRHRQVAQG